MPIPQWSEWSGFGWSSGTTATNITVYPATSYGGGYGGKFPDKELTARDWLASEIEDMCAFGRD